MIVADDAVGGEPVSPGQFPAKQGKYRDSGRKWPAATRKSACSGHVFNDLLPNCLSYETGNFVERAGNLASGTGTLEDEKGKAEKSRTRAKRRDNLSKARR